MSGATRTPTLDVAATYTLSATEDEVDKLVPPAGTRALYVYAETNDLVIRAGGTELDPDSDTLDISEDCLVVPADDLYGPFPLPLGQPVYVASATASTRYHPLFSSKM